MPYLDRLSAEPPALAIFTRQRWYPWLVVALVSIGAFIGQLDATIVQLALPTLGKTFSASLETVSWVSLAYLVAFASCLPICGRLCEMFGRKTLYIGGYALFVLATALCGLASDLGWLIVFRVLQGSAARCSRPVSGSPSFRWRSASSRPSAARSAIAWAPACSVSREWPCASPPC